MTQGSTLATGPRTGPRANWSVRVLGEFAVAGRYGPVVLPESTWRLVALLALTSQPMRRARVAGILWGEKDDGHAQASLRSALWRLGQAASGLVVAEQHILHLAPDVHVDVHDLRDLAARLEHGDRIEPSELDVRLCCADLLPDWYDDFVEDEREPIRQLRLRALETVARRLAERRQFGEALELAMLALVQAPLRETTHRLVLEIHLAEGNVSEAMRHYRHAESMLRRELGIEPSEQLRSVLPAFADPDQ